MHDRVRRERGQIIDALWSDPTDTALRHRAKQMGWCGAVPTVRAQGSKPAACLARCRDRLCPLCAKLRGVQAATRTRAIVGTFNAARFITLTLKHHDEPLRNTMERLQECLRKLRALPVWRQNVAGGVQAIETTYRYKTKMWHVHAHLIVCGRYLPQPRLKAAWLQVTGDSDIVHIRAVHDRDKSVDYVTRYIGKPLDPQTWPPERLREYAHAMKGKRLLQPFGTAMAVKLDQDDDESQAEGTRHVCGAHQLHAAAEAGIPGVQQAIEVLARCSGTFATMMLLPFDEQNPPPDPTEAEIEQALAVATMIGNTPLELLRDRACQPPSAPAPACDSSCSDSPAMNASLFGPPPASTGRKL